MKNIREQSEREGEAPAALPLEGATRAPIKTPIQIQLNGQSYSLEEPLSLAALITQFKIDAKVVAIAKNDEIVARSLLQETFVQNGDRVEMIRAVQGG